MNQSSKTHPPVLFVALSVVVAALLGAGAAAWIGYGPSMLGALLLSGLQYCF